MQNWIACVRSKRYSGEIIKICNASVYTSFGDFKQLDVLIRDDIIEAVTPRGELKHEHDEATVDGTGMFLIPGLTDIHFHGCVGYDFCDDPNMRRKGAALVGIHMEGPFLSPEKKGAQNALYIKKPDVEMYRRLQREYGGLIKLVDIAPEVEGAIEFIQAVHDEVRCSLAHTTADYKTAIGAFDNGASHVTHLYNAMEPFTHRAPGVIGAAADNPDVEVELICDGIHLHSAVVRSSLRLYGPERVILISDSMMATGMPDGLYSLGGQPVYVNGNRATLEDGTIAGSATNLMQCMRVMVQEMKVPLEIAVQCAAVNPTKSIGIYDNYGSITSGKVANLVLLNQELEVMRVILNGEDYAGYI